MTKEELIVGEYYYYPYDNGKDIYILQYEGKRVNTSLINIYKGIARYKSTEGAYLGFLDNCTRPATPVEIAWLKACIVANRLIPLKDIIEPAEPIYNLY